jgi:hypothetical protein
MSIFLDDDDVVKLTGKKLKAGQIDVLRRMGILFYVNAAGRPVVPIFSVDRHITTQQYQSINHGHRTC